MKQPHPTSLVRGFISLIIVMGIVSVIPTLDISPSMHGHAPVFQQVEQIKATKVKPCGK